MQAEFVQKNGLVVRMIARDLLVSSKGDKMKTISAYEEQIGCSRWTIQTAIKFLQDNDCMEILASGSRGSYISKLNRDKLLELSGWESLLGFLPVSSTDIHDALFTGIVDAVSHSGLPVNIAYMVPASKRFEMLSKNRCDFILTSRLAAELNHEYIDLVEAIELTGSRYCAPYRLYTMRSDIHAVEDGITMGIYDASIEQKYITNRLCESKDIRRKYGNYQNCLIMLATGEIDMLVQRSDLTDLPLPTCHSYPLPDINIGESVERPVILVNKSDYGIEALLRKHIDIRLISFVQKSVLTGRRRASFF